ncbi:tryptophan synthase subunit alpha [Candidatus Marinamargulisbacteria bacterium SCGC AG-410-N11]|nr:tryptophan synthase subunit alpha [Candidatus Marinamargulisbacteria bacterium SCGC AG-410-N11]
MSFKLLEDVFKESNVLVPYLTLGDHSLDFTKKMINAFICEGADIIELGIPFSDPIADGPTIQESHQRALGNRPDIGLDDAFNLVSEFSQLTNVPFVFMSAVNLIYNFGIERFFKSAKDVGLGGVIIPDLAVEDANEYIRFSKVYGVNLIFLVSPLCRQDRLESIVKSSSGFVYLISSVGITGERVSFSDNLDALVKKIKSIKDISVVVGFGISEPEQFKLVNSFADGAIIGSHFVKIINKYLPDEEKVVQEVVKRVKLFKTEA